MNTFDEDSFERLGVTTLRIANERNEAVAECSKMQAALKSLASDIRARADELYRYKSLPVDPLMVRTNKIVSMELHAVAVQIEALAGGDVDAATGTADDKLSDKTVAAARRYLDGFDPTDQNRVS